MNAHTTFRTDARPATSPAAMLAKSAVCVALVAGLAWIGIASFGAVEPVDPSVEAAAAVAGIANRGDHAAAHRREVFEQRRARFEARGGTQVAGGLAEHPAP